MTANRASRKVDRRRKRAGFTLIELMIVVVIIAILIALLLPAIGGAMRNAREGQVRSEIGQLESAIADFKAQYNMNPPSYIDLRLYDKSGSSYTLDPSGNYLLPKTVATLTRLWPNISLSGLITDLQTTTSKQREMDGSAALVFFLGGMVPGRGEAPVGFSANPRAPLTITTGGKRVGPYFEFRVDRLWEDDVTQPFNGYDGYLDTLPGQQVPYHYVTSEFYAATETFNESATAATQKNMRPVYRQGTPFFNAQGYQIVSPGQDGTNGEHDGLPGGAYGIGGSIKGDPPVLTDMLSSGHDFKGKAMGDADNITNISSGRLLP